MALQNPSSKTITQTRTQASPNPNHLNPNSTNGTPQNTDLSATLTKSLNQVLSKTEADWTSEQKKRVQKAAPSCPDPTRATWTQQIRIARSGPTLIRALMNMGSGFQPADMWLRFDAYKGYDVWVSQGRLELFKRCKRELIEAMDEFEKAHEGS